MRGRAIPDQVRLNLRCPREIYNRIEAELKYQKEVNPKGDHTIATLLRECVEKTLSEKERKRKYHKQRKQKSPFPKRSKVKSARAVRIHKPSQEEE